MLKNNSKTQSLFLPISSVVFVSENNYQEISKEDINPNIIGHKAFGLTCLPKLWTLPFLCISDELFSSYCDTQNIFQQNNILKKWAERIVTAASLIGISPSSKIIIRSSGKSESLEERGKFHSSKGSFDNLLIVLKNCISTLASEDELRKQKIPLVLQVYCSQNYANGHLSNERRWSKENRDWVVEYETFKTRSSNNSYKINLRNWRKIIDINSLKEEPLSCSLSPHISNALKIAAAWAYELKIRVHFEWCWDGSKIILVQADLEHDSVGIDPIQINKPNRILSERFKPKCLKEISQDNIQYHKIENVFIYLKLNLIDKTNLYILENQDIIQKLSTGQNVDILEEDLRELVKDSLVIRMDIETDDRNKRQLLPRTNEVRSLEVAMDWLRKESNRFVSDPQNKEKIVFIFHNFIPAVSSAFAYAAPGNRNVQIESLWGLPEGLYYNSHDKYAVDTKNSKIETIHHEDVKNFTVDVKRNSKRFIIAPDSDGIWTSKSVKPTFYWRSSIKPQSLVKQIAYESRLIAEEVGEPISIMWFIGIPSEISKKSILPWYHEVFDPNIMNRAQTKRKKKYFDESFLIRKMADLRKLEIESNTTYPKIRRIRIQPCEDELIRDKETLKKIGEIAKKINAVILLEGGILSHAYYQLITTNAIVEINHPFSDIEGKQEFRKLVRDKVPIKIEDGGELVEKGQLVGENLLKALKEKLIEESFEVLDAIDQEQIIAELSDVSEVIDAILSKIKVSKTKLKQIQEKKRKKVGGFNEGFILIETKNPLPQSQENKEKTLFDDAPNPIPILKENPEITKWTDKRELDKGKTTLLTLEVPSIMDSWASDFPKIQLKLDTDTDIKITGNINGKRNGSKLTINISITVPNFQLKLF